MPTYQARRVTVRLLATDLDKTGSKRFRPNSTEFSSILFSQETDFATAGGHEVLPELPIRSDPASDSVIQFLKDEDGRQFTPFCMVVAGSSVSTLEAQSADPKSGAREERSHSSTQTSQKHQFENDLETFLPQSGLMSRHAQEQGLGAGLGVLSNPFRPLEPVPKGLLLKVELEKESFLTTYGFKKDHLDLKIDVFFNGDRCASTLVTERARVQSSLKNELVQYYSGLRVQNRRERPWILVPTGQGVDWFSRHNGQEGREADQRWERINQSLSRQAEAERHQIGELSKLGIYLKNLSKLEFPSEAKSRLNASASRFGVIDIVISAGNGKKDPAWTNKMEKPTGVRTDLDYVSPEWTESHAGSMARDVKETLKNRPVTLEEVRAKKTLLTGDSDLTLHTHRLQLGEPIIGPPNGNQRGRFDTIEEVDESEHMTVAEMESWGIGTVHRRRPSPLSHPMSEGTKNMIQKIIDTEARILKSTAVIRGKEKSVDDTSTYPLTIYGQLFKENEQAAKENEQAATENEQVAKENELTDENNGQQEANMSGQDVNMSGQDANMIGQDVEMDEQTSSARAGRRGPRTWLGAMSTIPLKESTPPRPWAKKSSSRKLADSTPTTAIASSRRVHQGTQGSPTPIVPRRRTRNSMEAASHAQPSHFGLGALSTSAPSTQRASDTNPLTYLTRRTQKLGLENPNAPEGIASPVEDLEPPPTKRRYKKHKVNPSVSFVHPSKAPKTAEEEFQTIAESSTRKAQGRQNPAGPRDTPVPARRTRGLARTLSNPADAASPTAPVAPVEVPVAPSPSQPKTALFRIPRRMQPAEDQSSNDKGQPIVSPERPIRGPSSHSTTGKTRSSQRTSSTTYVANPSTTSQRWPETPSRTHFGSSSSNTLPPLTSSPSPAHGAVPAQSQQPFWHHQLPPLDRKGKTPERREERPSGPERVGVPSRDTNATASIHDAAWKMPPLSEGSVATYAADRLRPVKEERSGWFREDQVVVGFRYLVG